MDTFITFDTDHIGCNSRFYTTDLSFEYELDRLYNYLGPMPHTAFVRIDHQIKNTFGNYLHVYDMIRSPEIGWHPHCEEPELRQIYDAEPKVREMKCVRMDGAVMTNRIMRTLSDLNFRVDSSALPACSRNDQHRRYDWGITGNTPYRPFVHDYRTPGDPHLPILEIPMTTIPVVAPYDRNFQRRYVNPTMRKEIFQPALEAVFDRLLLLVVTFHPDQLMEGYEDDLYRYGMDNFVSNMELIRSFNGTYKTLGAY